MTQEAFEMVERKEPVKFTFSEGVVLRGALLDVKRTQVRDEKTGMTKPAMRYTVLEVETDVPVFFFGTYQIDSKLSPRDVGHMVEIRQEGEDKSAGRNGNAMKLFRVFVSKSMAPGFANDGTPITTDDIGF